LQSPTAPEGVAITTPAGRLSVNPIATSVCELGDGLVMVKVRVEVPFNAIALGLNALLMEGGATTEIAAEAAPPVPPSVEVTLPVVLFFAPALVPVTFTENVQLPFPAIVPPAPLRLIVFDPAFAVIVPGAQPVLNPFGVDTTNPDGSVSLNFTPLSDVPLLF
jgi:hypothetical protein